MLKIPSKFETKYFLGLNNKGKIGLSDIIPFFIFDFNNIGFYVVATVSKVIFKADRSHITGMLRVILT